MRELLIRYLLGELEPHEHDAVHRQLAESPELRKELARLRECFAESRHAEEEPGGPPLGLAERTAVRVSESGTHEKPVVAQAARVRSNDELDTPASALGWSLADLTVAGGVILAVSMMLFPAIRQSRDETRRVGCQNNLRQLGQLLTIYTLNNGRYLPHVQPGENAGIFTTRLVDSHIIDENGLKKLLSCPGSKLSELMANGEFDVVIPTSAELQAMSDEQRAMVASRMSPMYAYAFGFQIGGQYHFRRIDGFRRPVVSDAPSSEANGMSANHCGTLIQVLYTDGSVAVLTSAKVDGGHDELFWNLNGEVAAGVGTNDSVLAPSEATPGVIFIGSDRSTAKPNFQTLNWHFEPSRERPLSTLKQQH
jgi:hypothetical protein